MSGKNDLAGRAGAPGTQLEGHSPGRQPAASDRVLRVLDPARCFRLLEPGGIGRVGFTSATGVVILPVNFALTGNCVVFRTAPDTVLAVRGGTRISFEADRIDEAVCEGWSVLIQGHAHNVTDELDVRRLESTTGLEPWAGGARDVWVRITPVQISGRRIQPR